MMRKRDDTPEQPNSKSCRDRWTDRQIKGEGRGKTWEQREETLRVMTKALPEAEDTVGSEGPLWCFCTMNENKGPVQVCDGAIPSTQDAASLPEASREQESGSHAEDGNLSGRRDSRVLSNADLFWEGHPPSGT